MKTLRQILCVTVMTLGLAIVMTGCGSPNSIHPQAIRHNMSPELESVAQTRDQRANNYARTWDYDNRQIIDDWDAFWLMNRPSRMSYYPIP